VVYRSKIVNLWQHGLMPTTAVLAERTPLDAVACCSSPVTGGALGVEQAEQLALLLRALADPTRLRLLSLVAAHADNEACVCDLTAPVGLSQPTVSHHLKVLVDAGLLTREQRGKWAYYRIVEGALNAVAEAIAQPSR
jgi:ArsR family transcriptional regulator